MDTDTGEAWADLEERKRFLEEQLKEVDALITQEKGEK